MRAVRVAGRVIAVLAVAALLAGCVLAVIATSR
jgi:hypothetical protein